MELVSGVRFQVSGKQVKRFRVGYFLEINGRNFDAIDP